MEQLQNTDKEVAAAILGAAVAGGFALIALFFGWLFEVRRWRRDRVIRDEDWKRNEQARDNDRRREQEVRDSEWLREKALAAYSDAVYYLFKLSLSSKRDGLESKDVRQHISESRRHLLLIRAHTPDLADAVDDLFAELNVAVQDRSAKPLSDVADSLGHRVVELLTNDLRFHVSPPASAVGTPG